MNAKKLNILFVCTGNSCRSQVAEGWARNLKGDLISPSSAGIETHGLNPYAITVMAEAGIDISKQTSDLIDDYSVTKFDYIITVCDHAQETCPVIQGPCQQFHINFDDPPKLAEHLTSEQEILDCYRKVRDTIKEFILTLPGSLK